MSFGLTTARRFKSRASPSLVLAALSIGLCQASLAQGVPSADGRATLFQNVRIFDGKSAALSAPSNVLVEGNVIEHDLDAIRSPRKQRVTVIDGGGRTLMPGLIDVHWHAMLVRLTPAISSWQRRRLHQPSGGRRGRRRR